MCRAVYGTVHPRAGREGPEGANRCSFTSPLTSASDALTPGNIPVTTVLGINIYTVIPRLTKIIRSGIIFVSRNLR